MLFVWFFEAALSKLGFKGRKGKPRFHLGPWAPLYYGFDIEAHTFWGSLGPS